MIRRAGQDAVVATQVGGRYKVWVVLGSGAPRVADFARWSFFF
jgi:hypothetical protein